jgi:hypothetical protein
MKTKAALSDININKFHPAIQSDVKADIATAQSLLDQFAAMSYIISRLKSAVTSLLPGDAKDTEAKAV